MIFVFVFVFSFFMVLLYYSNTQELPLLYLLRCWYILFLFLYILVFIILIKRPLFTETLIRRYSLFTLLDSFLIDLQESVDSHEFVERSVIKGLIKHYQPWYIINIRYYINLYLGLKAFCGLLVFSFYLFFIDIFAYKSFCSMFLWIYHIWCMVYPFYILHNDTPFLFIHFLYIYEDVNNFYVSVFFKYDV